MIPLLSLISLILEFPRLLSHISRRYKDIRFSISPKSFETNVRFRAKRIHRTVPRCGQSRSVGEINRVWWSISGYAFDSVNGNKLLARKGRRREPTPGFRERFVMDDRRYTEKWWWMKSRPRINIGRNLLHVNNAITCPAGRLNKKKENTISWDNDDTNRSSIIT